MEFSLDGEYVRKRHVDFAILSSLDPDNELIELTQPDEGTLSAVSFLVLSWSFIYLFFIHTDIDLSDVTSIVDPLSKVEAGLKGSGGQPVPLQAVHIRAKLLDLVAQVTM